MTKNLSEIIHNCQIKVYPNGDALVSVYSSDILRESGWEERGAKPREPSSSGETGTDVARSKRRARAAVSDLVLSNDFKYFVTLTLDPAQVNRYDSFEVTKKLNRWLDNQVRRKGLAYVLVPELHKDGAIHFHGFFNDALSVMDSGTVSMPGGGKPRRPRSKRQREQWLTDGGHVVYNLPGWTLGYTTAIELYGERRAAVGYCCKYITKAQVKVGGRWYYSGGALQRPEILLTDVDYAELLAVHNEQEFLIPALNCTGFRFWIDGGKECGKVETSGAAADV